MPLAQNSLFQVFSLAPSGLLTDQAFPQGSIYPHPGLLAPWHRVDDLHTVQSSIHWQGFHHCPFGQGPLGGPW